MGLSLLRVAMSDPHLSTADRTNHGSSSFARPPLLSYRTSLMVYNTIMSYGKKHDAIEKIYAGSVMIEAKCIGLKSEQPSSTATEGLPLEPLHSITPHQHHDIYLASQTPFGTPPTRRFKTCYTLSTVIYRYGLRHSSQSLYHRLPDTISHILGCLSHLNFQPLVLMALFIGPVAAHVDPVQWHAASPAHSEATPSKSSLDPSRHSQDLNLPSFPTWLFPILCYTFLGIIFLVARIKKWEPTSVSGTLAVVVWWLWLYMKRDPNVSPWYLWT